MPMDLGLGFFQGADDPDEIFFDYHAPPQPYVLLANSKGMRITNKDGLGTVQCFEMILNTKLQYPDSIFVGFGFNYDINQMLKDVPREHLEAIHDQGFTNVGGYYIKWHPRKSLIIKHHRSKRSAIIYDVFGFFQTSFIRVCQTYLGKNDPELGLIQRGKNARDVFTWEELDEFIIPYNDTELSMLVRIMDKLREDFWTVSVTPSRWHGPGAIATQVFANLKIPISRDIPEEVLDASQFAYAGGRFEHFRMGRYAGRVYENDIHSAYPEGATHLPDLSRGSWEYVNEWEPGGFGVWNIDYNGTTGRSDKDNRPHPLFCRAKSGNISYPAKVQGWYWTPEASFVTDFIQGGWVFRADTDHRPFAALEGMYDRRRILQDQENPAERALKLILNSVYGKLAQTVGAKNKPPQWHQLEYAGYITSYTRAKIYAAMLQKPDSLIAVETDALFTTEPLDLPHSGALGDWEETIFDEIIYLQSGYYYALEGDIVTCKYRGMDHDRKTRQPLGLDYDTVCEMLQQFTGFTEGPSPALFTYTTRFIGLGLGLKTSANWRSWEKTPKCIKLNADSRYSKRYHRSSECPLCQAGINMYRQDHPLQIGGYSGKSYPRSLPWRQHLLGADIEQDEWLEMNTDFRDYQENIDKWQ